MKILNSLFVLLLTSNFLFSQAGTTIFKGVSEGMTKKQFKAEHKANKSDYKDINLGNDVVWTLASSNGIFEPKDNLVGIKFIAKGVIYPLNDLGIDGTVNYLRETEKYLLNNGYVKFYEDEENEIRWVVLFNYSVKWGAVYVNYTQKKVAHLIPYQWETKTDWKYIPYFELYSIDPFMKMWEKDNKGKKSAGI